MCVSTGGQGCTAPDERLRSSGWVEGVTRRSSATSVTGIPFACGPTRNRINEAARHALELLTTLVSPSGVPVLDLLTTVASMGAVLSSANSAGSELFGSGCGGSGANGPEAERLRAFVRDATASGPTQAAALTSLALLQVALEPLLRTIQVGCQRPCLRQLSPRV